ncbi:hypothetical protein Ancab_013342 [Ancistrocladus abbreviatus]
MEMTLTLLGGRCPTMVAKFIDRKLRTDNNQQSRGLLVLPCEKDLIGRRCGLVHSGISLASILTLSQGMVSSPVWAEDKSDGQEEEDKGITGAITSLFDPNEKTKSGKVLPKAYLRSARELVKTLRESLKEDPKDISRFRRTADAAKESIRDYLNNWRGQQTVSKEESYVELEKAIRSLASFYSKAGPSAPLPEEVKSEILSDLEVAEQFL